MISAIDSSPIVIRSACSQDRQAIIELETLAMRTLCQDNYDLAQINHLAEKIPALRFNDEIIVVAEQDDCIVGFASLLRDRAFLRTLYVQPKFTFHELGLKLLLAIEREARKFRIDTLRLTSTLSEKAFYDAQGYQAVGCCNLSKMDILVPGVAMQKRLQPVSQKVVASYCKRAISATVPNALFLLLAL